MVGVRLAMSRAPIVLLIAVVLELSALRRTSGVAVVRLAAPMRLFFTVFSLVVFVACGPLSPPKSDSGEADAGLDAGAVDAGTLDAGSLDAGTLDAGTLDAGLPDAGTMDAGLAPLTWSLMSLSGGVGTGPIIGIGGVPGDVWALKDNGELFHSSGGAFQLAVEFPGGVKGLAVSDGGVLVLRYRALLLCSGASCTQPGDYSEFDLVSRGLDSEAACVGPDGQFAVIASDTSSMGRLLERDAGTWVVSSSLALRYPRGCWFGSDGALFIAGESNVIRYENGAGSTEPVDTGAVRTLFGGAEVGGEHWVSGASGVVARRVGTSWSPVPTTGTNTMFAVGGLRADEVFVFGAFQTGIGNGYRWNGTTLTGVGALLPGAAGGSSMRVVHATGPDELYVGGQSSNASLLIRGRR